MKPPTPESYWVTAQVLAGKYPGSLDEDRAKQKVEPLLQAGVRSFIDLTDDGELSPYRQLLPVGVEHHRVGIRDVTAPSPEQVRAVLELIERGCSRGAVYIHCRGGCGRTGVIVGCYLVERGSSADDALKRVHELTRALQDGPCPQTCEQVAVVREWKPPRRPSPSPADR